MTFEAIPPWIRVALSTSTNVSPPTSTSSGGTATTGASPSTARSIALTPCQGRAEWALSPWNVSVALRLPRQPGVDRVVGRLEHDDKVGLEHERRLGEDAREGALLGRELLPHEEQKREVERTWRAGRPAGQLDHHGDPALHVARAEADHPAVLDPPGDVVLGGHGVEVACEQDERRVRCARSRRGAPRRCRRRAEAARRRRRARGGPPPPGSARGCRSARACGVRDPRPGG